MLQNCAFIQNFVKSLYDNYALTVIMSDNFTNKALKLCDINLALIQSSLKCTL